MPDDDLIQHFPLQLRDNMILIRRILNMRVGNPRDLRHKVRDFLRRLNIGIIKLISMLIDQRNTGKAFLLARFDELAVDCDKLIGVLATFLFLFLGLGRMGFFEEFFPI